MLAHRVNNVLGRISFRAFSIAVHPPNDLPNLDSKIDSRAERALKLAKSNFDNERAEAYSLATAAAEEGCVRSKALRGAFLELGLGCTADHEKGRELLQSAAHQGDIHGIVLYGLSLVTVKDDKDNDIELQTLTDGDRFAIELSNVVPETPGAITRRERKARRNAGFRDEEGPEYVASLQAKKKAEIEANREAGVAWLELAEARGSDMAMVILGNLANERGDGKAAVSWFERAIELTRNTDAYFNLGRILEDGKNGVTKDVTRANRCFSMAAQLGDPTAQVYMAHIYRTGSFEREPDLEAARTYVEQAAAQKHPEALYMLAGMHRAGEAGLSPDEARYVRYLSAASENGFADAIAELADLRYKGEAGVKKDNVAAFEGFCRAGELGHANAMTSAAAMQYHGRGVEKNAHEAFLKYQKAVVLGSVSAMRNVGAMYFRGDGVPKNLKMAETFFKLADDTASQLKQTNKFEQPGPMYTTEAQPHMMNEMRDKMDKSSIKE